MANNFFRIKNGLNILGLTSAPQNPENGDIYYDITSNSFKFYQNGTWTSGGGGGGSLSIGGAISGATPNSLLYAGAAGVLAQDNSTLYYDYVNSRLGVGTTTPSTKLDIVGGLKVVGSRYTNPSDDGSTGDLTQAGERLAQSITPTASIAVSDISFRIKRSGLAPNVTMQMSIATDNAGEPGTIVATSNVISSTVLTTTAQDILFTLSSPYTLSSGVKYWLVFTMPTVTTLNGSRYVRISWNQSGGFALGTSYYYDPNFVTWSDNSPTDVYFVLNANGIGTTTDSLKITGLTTDGPVISASGLLSTEAQLSKTRGGTGLSSTAVFPSSGTILTKEILSRSNLVPSTSLPTLLNMTLTSAVGSALIQGCAYSQDLGIFIASDSVGKVYQSVDGNSWVPSGSIAKNGYIGNATAWSPELGLWVSIGAGYFNYALKTSKDGANWDTYTNPDGTGISNAQSVAWSPKLKLFVACGQYSSVGKIWYSADGFSWTEVAVSTSSWSSIVWSPALECFVMAASSAASHTFAKSVDGINWTFTNFGNTNISPSCLAWSPELSLFVAVGTTSGNNASITSPDGVTWTQQINGSITQQLTSLVWIPELSIFVTSTGSTTWYYSSDGINWSTFTAAAGGFNLLWGGESGVLVARTYSQSNTMLVSHFFGKTQQDSARRQVAKKFGGSGRDNSGINFPAWGNLDKKLINPSLSGRASGAWSSITTPIDASWKDVVWSQDLGLFVMVGGGLTTNAMTSPDGVTWTARTTVNGASTSWNSVTYSPELKLFVACGNSGSNANNIMTSPDGITWTARNTSGADNLTGIVWAAELGLFVIAGTSCIYTSPDSVTWTSRTIALSSWSDIAWSPELNLFVVCSSSSNGQIATSPDGITWTLRLNLGALLSTFGMSPNSITWSSDLGRFFIVGNASTVATPVMLSSKDGIAWSVYYNTLPSTTDNWYKIEWSQEHSQLVAVGDNGKLAYSADGFNWTGVSSPVVKNFRCVGWSPQLGIWVAGSNSGVSSTIISSRFVGSSTATVPLKIRGTTTNNNAAAGDVGELIASNPVSNVTPAATNSYVNVHSISLTAGDWDVSGTINLDTGGTTVATHYMGAISLTSGTFDTFNEGGIAWVYGSLAVSASHISALSPRRISVSTNTTVYLIARAAYTTLGGATWTTRSRLYARRVR
jgi:hypothetical protein